MLSSKKSAFLIILILALTSSFLWGEKIELKNGTIIEGAVKEIKDEMVILDIGESKEIGISLDEIVPSSVYRIKLRFIEPAKAQSHLELAEFCLKHKLYQFARYELTKATELDESLKEENDEKINALIEEECREVIDSALSLMNKNKYEEALRNLQELINKYPDSKYTEEATKAAAFAAQVIRTKIEDDTRKKEDDAKKKEQERLTKEETAFRSKFNDAVKLIKDAWALNAEALNYETEYKVMLADKAYKTAEERLMAAKSILVAVLDQTKNTNLINDAKEKISEVNGWLVTVYNNLGQLWAMELKFRESIKWLNKTLALDPTHKAAIELKGKIIDIEARRKLLQQENR